MAETESTGSSRSAVVTGASSGIGRATAVALRERGWTVFAAARRLDRLESLAAEAGAIPVELDVTDPESVAALADMVAAHGGVDALLNIAGGAIGVDPAEDAAIADWQAMYDLNVLGTLRVVQALLPLLRGAARQHCGADILTVTSTAGLVAYEGGGGYTAAKHAEQDLMDTLRLELNGEPIRVQSVAPGLVATEEFSLNRLHGDADAAAKVYEGVPQPLTGADIAQVIVSILSLPPHVNIDLAVVRPVAQAAQHKLYHGDLRVDPQRRIVEASASPAVPAAQKGSDQ